MSVAVISGTTSGLGREYVDAVIHECPEIDEIWMVARRMNRMKEIEKDYPNMRFYSISLDLSKDESYKELEEILSEKRPDIGVLISNSGVAFNGYVDEITPENTATMCDLNVKGGTMLIRLCLPYVKRGGYILLVASTSAFVPNPHLNVYSATKAYVASFSLGLRQELKPRGINVCSALPGRMRTEMEDKMATTQRLGAFNLVPSLDVKKFAYKSLRAAKHGRASYTMLLFYKLFRVVAKILPAIFMVKFTKI